MNQQPIDLLPRDIREKCQAGLRTGRYVAAVMAGVLVTTILATHARFDDARTQERYAEVKEHADLVIQMEERTVHLQKALDETNEFIELQRKIAFPVDASLLLATLINHLPDGMTLERIDFDANPRRQGRTARNRSRDADQAPPRLLHGELSGFAISDDSIAELVNRLQKLEPFREISLDFSRTRMVRNVSAREFRISFRVPFDRPYTVEIADAGPAGGGAVQ